MSHVRLLQVAVVQFNEFREPFDLLYCHRCHDNSSVLFLLVVEEFNGALANRTADVLDFLAFRVRLILGFANYANIRVTVLNNIVMTDVDLRKLWECSVCLRSPRFPSRAVSIFTLENLESRNC